MESSIKSGKMKSWWLQSQTFTESRTIGKTEYRKNPKKPLQRMVDSGRERDPRSSFECDGCGEVIRGSVNPVRKDGALTPP
jgi:hypothetical protein